MKTFYLPEQSGSLTALAWSPSGQQIAGVCEDGTAVVWQVATGNVIFARRMARAKLLTVTWSENGRCLAIGGENNAFTMIQVRDGALVFSQVLDASVQKISFAPRGRRFLVAAGQTISVYCEEHREPIQLAQPSPVIDVAWSPSGGRFAAVCQHGDVFIYSVLRKRTVYTLTEEDISEPCSIAWNSDGRDVAVGTSRGTIQIYDGSRGSKFTTYTLSSHRISHLCWGNPCLAALDSRAEMTLWDLLPREHSAMLAHRSPSAQQALAFSPNGQQIATGCQHMVSIAPVG